MKILAEFNKRSLSFGNENMVSFFCVFGRDGITENKIEGDWKTPIGTFSIRKIYYRSDKIFKLDTKIECISLTKKDIWCDDSTKEEYNTFTRLPFEGSYENLWREDDMYDVIIVLGHNDSPAIKGRGSAIFIHIAKENMKYTQGCLALKKEDIMSLIKEIDSKTKIIITP